jgi:hypothetical protein
VDETTAVRGRQCVEDGLGDGQGALERERSVDAQLGAQVVPVDVLHGEVEGVLPHPLVEDPDHVGMREPGRGARLATEPAHEVLGLCEVGNA